MLFLNQKGKEQTLGNKVNMQRSRTRVLDLLELYSHTHTTLLIVQQRLLYIPSPRAWLLNLQKASCRMASLLSQSDHKPRGPEDNFIARSLALLVMLCCLSDLCLY